MTINVPQGCEALGTRYTLGEGWPETVSVFDGEGWPETVSVFDGSNSSRKLRTPAAQIALPNATKGRFGAT